MGAFFTQMFLEHMLKNITTQGVQKFIFRFEMRIESASANIRLIDNFLYCDVG